MKATARRLFSFLFLQLDLEVGCGLVAAFVGAHWMYWRTFNLPPYRVLAAAAAAVHLPGECLWGIPLVVLGLCQVAAVWRGWLRGRRLVCRLHAVWLTVIGFVMVFTLPRSIVAWFMLLGVYAQLSVYCQLPWCKAVDPARLHCLVLPALALALLADGFDKESITYLGVACAVAIAAIPALDTVKRWVKGDQREDVHLKAPQPLVIAPQPVFASVELVSKVDQDLRATVNKLEKYVHESVHEQGSKMQEMLTLIQGSNEDHRDAIYDVNKQGEERITKVHDRLNEVVREIGGLNADSKHTTQRLVAMQQTLEVLLSRTAPGARRGGAQG